MKTPENKNEVLELFKRGPAILESVLAELSNTELDYAPSNGSWSIRQIVHHLLVHSLMRSLENLHQDRIRE